MNDTTIVPVEGLAEPLPPHAALLLKQAQESARTVFDQLGEYPPQLMGVTPEMQCLPPLRMTGLSKGFASHIIDEMRKELAVAFVHEAWMTMIPSKPGSPLTEAMKSGDPDALIIPPRLDPNHKEVVLLQLFVGARRIVGSAVITRPESGKPTLGDWRIMDSAAPGAVIHRKNFEPDTDGKLASGIVK